MSLQRLAKELKALEECSHFNAKPFDNDVSNWTATIPGPVGSRYENKHFQVTIRIPNNYPFSPPEVSMKTQILHPNILMGYIHLDILEDKWSPTLNIQKVLLSISSLLEKPNLKFLSSDISRKSSSLSHLF